MFLTRKSVILLKHVLMFLIPSIPSLTSVFPQFSYKVFLANNFQELKWRIYLPNCDL